MLALTPLSWLVFIPAVLCWPVAGVIVYYVWKKSKHHEEEAEAQRRALLEAHARATADPGVPPS
jgi:heme/copper-type cytochrome/quinol oxidase subunit 2